jgi:hypothetical protein
VVSGTADQDMLNRKQSSLFQQCFFNAYLINNDLGGWWKEQNHDKRK